MLRVLERARNVTDPIYTTIFFAFTVAAAALLAVQVVGYLITLHRANRVLTSLRALRAADDGEGTTAAGGGAAAHAIAVSLSGCIAHAIAVEASEASQRPRRPHRAMPQPPRRGV